MRGGTPYTQVEDAAKVIKSYPNPCFVGWDYSFENPRRDLRGFSAAQLSVDPTDAQFDQGSGGGWGPDTRQDRVLVSGARLYNDHGHPELSTAEQFDPVAAVWADLDGESDVWSAALAFADGDVTALNVYKNNTDFHGASYGSHESYLVPRSVPFDRLQSLMLPILVGRNILCGAGKVGSENTAPCHYQLSQRADFFSEIASVDTLYRRPLMNTRDEPHAQPSDWIRLHVITGDANRNPWSCLFRIVLAGLAVELAQTDWVPPVLADPLRAMQSISRDSGREYRVQLEDGSASSAYEIVRGYLRAGRGLAGWIQSAEFALDAMESVLDALPDVASEVPIRYLDWVAKENLCQQYIDGLGVSWGDPTLRSVDLAYSDLDPEVSLYPAMIEMGLVEPFPIARPSEALTRGAVRGLAVERFSSYLREVCWRRMRFEVEGKSASVELDARTEYPLSIAGTQDVREFVGVLGSTFDE